MRQQRAIRYNLGPEIVQVGRLLYDRGLIVASEGNISTRLENDLVLITPTGLCKGMLTPDDLVVLDIEGRVVHSINDRTPSSEYSLHLLLYQMRPDVHAIVHAHPPIAVAATMANITMEPTLLPELYMVLGEVPTVPYAPGGTDEMRDTISPFVADHEALLLSHHGALTMGETVMQTYLRMEQLEHAAQILMAAHQFGGAQHLPPERLANLKMLRARRRQRKG